MNCIRMFLLSIFLIGAVLFHQYTNLCSTVAPPELNLTAYWGAGNESDYKESDEIQLQKIIYFDKPIKRLKRYLKNMETITESLEGVGFDYGVNSNQLKSFVKYWREDYMPRWHWDREHTLNLLPQFLTVIQGYNLWYKFGI